MRGSECRRISIQPFRRDNAIFLQISARFLTHFCFRMLSPGQVPSELARWPPDCRGGAYFVPIFVSFLSSSLFLKVMFT